MKNLLTALVLGLACAASARAIPAPVEKGDKTAAVGDICDRLHEYGSPSWQACRRAIMADASSLICGREPQLDICKKGQLLSSAEREKVITKASLICGTDPQLDICKRRKNILTAADSSLICGYEPQLSICKKGSAILSDAGGPVRVTVASYEPKEITAAQLDLFKGL